MAVIMLFAIALPLSTSTAFATTDISDTSSSQVNSNHGQISANSDQNSENNGNGTTQTVTVSTEQAGSISATTQTATTPTTTSQTITQTNNSSSKNIAAGSVTTATGSTPVSFTQAQISGAASNMKSFVETNHRLPTYVTVNNYQVSVPQFLYLMAQNLLYTNNGLKVSVSLKTVASPSKPSGTVKNGDIYKTGYINLAKSITTSISSTGTAPNYISSSLGQIRYESLVYTLSKILNFQASSHRLPSYVSVTSWSLTLSEGYISSTVPSSLQAYLEPTANCQSTNSEIVSLANSITAGETSTYAKAAAIFDWVRDNLSYSYYYNTKKGALGALSSRSANCADTSHLVVALSRAAGIPARYQLGTCHFSSGWYGHVWAQLYVNGKWYYADAISNSNSFGVINNWNLNTYKLRGTYSSLPF